MKKKTTLPFLFAILICIYACADYKPIFGSANLEFEIVDYSVEGDRKLGTKIYSKLYNLSKSNKNQKEITSVVVNIKVLKEKNSTSKDATGKILEYKINLNTKVIVKNYLTNDTLLDKNFISSSSYKVQDQYSETIKHENKVIENLIDRTYQELLIKLSENILTK
jgi:hypothetical protein